MSQQSHADLTAKLRQLLAINRQRSQSILEFYEMTRSVCKALNDELGDPNGLTVSDINTEVLNLGIFSLPTLPTWEISFYGDKLADCSIAGDREVFKPGFSIQKQKVALSVIVANLPFHWMQIGNETRWCMFDEQKKTFIPVEDLEGRVKTKLIEAMIEKADGLIQDRSPKPPAWR